ncbi:MAG: Serine/threonine-protein kinase ulk2 [Pycnora praestabilis]|nr:MAG: Serine/threonine-protein kinase ulk2 [Pycnora praestabilis]
MAAQPPAPSSSRRSRESGQGDMTIGNFRRMEEIGRGSFATVYKAVHVKKGAFVAIKSVHLQKLNKKLKDNLYSEIHILKGLHHPHIVALIDCQESTAHIHLVMEFCQLGDLSYFIKKRDKLAGHAATSDMIRKYPNPPGGGLNEVVVRHFLKQLASALEFLRAKNFIHRDVKPQNLLLNPSPLFFAKAQQEIMPYTPSEDSLVPMVGVESLPMLKIADFGFARSLPSTSLAETLCGSPLYMAPEILRYEKYDAKADLWSVGTVLYEMMVGKPPFRASNHVELLRKIERGDDKIRFPEETILSDGMKKLIRGLLRRNPVERMGFKDFFDHVVVKDDIPGLVDVDRPPVPVSSVEEVAPVPQPATLDRRKTSFAGDPQPLGTDRGDRVGEIHQYSGSSRDGAGQESPAPQPIEARPEVIRQLTGTPPRPPSGHRRYSTQAPIAPPPSMDQRDMPQQLRRPAITSHATAPARNDLYQDRSPVAAAVAMERQSSRNTPSPGSSFLKEQAPDRDRIQQQKNDRFSREEQERVAQEVAFERDYVVVEKRAVEVNAFADELAASPRLNPPSSSPQHGTMIRRATTQGPPNSTSGAQVTPSRAMQIATGKQRPDPIHQRKSSYERRYGASPSSATSAISKALNMANFRLFGMGFSPPLGLGKGGVSPPRAYGAFPAYPTTQGSLVMIDDGSKGPAPLDEDAKAIHVIEESATRSDVVYGFAEVKYKQLIPLAPSMEHGLGLRQAGISEKHEDSTAAAADDGLTVDAIVTLSEEALVLYVKALSLLARSMDIAGAWWAHKNRGEVIGESHFPRLEPSNAAALGSRANNVVQWVRSRFNEVLEKAEFVRLKLLDGQKRLPTDHPGHPSNHPSASTSTAGMGTSAEDVVVGSGVTAEKLMYDRALEMSRTAAVNELVGEDLPGCEIAYVTAVRMLEAVLESDDEPTSRKCSATFKEEKRSKTDDEPINGVEAEDRQVVIKLVSSIRGRLTALRKKMAIMQKRSSLASAPPMKPSGNVTPIPTIATTPPR